LTVVCAVKFVTKDNKTLVVAASDSAVTTDDNRMVGIENQSKLFSVEGAIVGICGGGSIAEVLEDLENNKEITKGLDLSTRKGVRSLAEIIYKNFADYLGVSLADKGVFDGIGPLIIACPNAIYKIFPDFSCYSYDRFTATGFEEIFYGAMEVLYPSLELVDRLDEVKIEDLEEAVRKSFEAVFKYSLRCGPPIHFAHPKTIIKRGRPKKNDK
jgi:hypothetical protein